MTRASVGQVVGVALLFGYLSLGMQEKVTRQQAKQNFKKKLRNKKN